MNLAPTQTLSEAQAADVGAYCQEDNMTIAPTDLPMTSKVPSSVRSLEDVVTQLVNLGLEDPLSIARKVIETNDPGWLADQLVMYGEDFIADMARRKLRAESNKAELALRPGDIVASGELKIKKYWIPGLGWKTAADLTSDDFRARAGWYDAFATASAQRAAWCRDVADLMDSEGAQVLGDLHVPLPPVPGDSLEELAA